MKLHEITTELELLYDEITMQDGEISPEQEAHLMRLEGDRESKLANCAAYVANLDDTIEGIEQAMERVEREIARLQARLRVQTNEKGKFLAYVGRHLRQGQNWSNAVFDFKWSHSEPVLVDPSIDIKQLPEQFIRYKETYAPDKTALKKALKAGTVIEGIKLGDNWNLRLDKGREDAEKREGKGSQERTKSEEVPF